MQPFKIVFGYAGTEKWGVLPSCFVLCSFLIPLSIALGASANTDFSSEIDHFGTFPYDPFPSYTGNFFSEAISLHSPYSFFLPIFQTISKEDLYFVLKIVWKTGNESECGLGKNFLLKKKLLVKRVAIV